ncbi:hypothetical protein [Cellulomonas sp.]|uniref:hypothetical protein n=1 Tax=Cellulomonas sp. TaxID=40001 RepID=UPI003BAC02CB
MSSRTWRIGGGLVAVALTVSLTACSDAGDLSIRNEGSADVTVLTGDEEVTVSAGGGAVLLDYGCTPGDVTVELPSDEPVVLAGPVCPGQEIVIRDGTVGLERTNAG